ncbi:MAG TPA: HupE/UreJ family protein [Burkholderiales bacterium]|nr:HupE/UreJ family protein [Burkholderiales bacterium]
MKSRLVLAVFASLLPVAAWAHPGHGASGFTGGLVHPLSGLDHILGMLSVGIWASGGSRNARRLVPLAFLFGMSAGGFMGIEGFFPSFLESAVAASVFASALMVALSVRLPLTLQAGFAALFALWHGMAHGAELPAMTHAAGYVAGFLFSTALLLGIGVATGTLLREKRPLLGAGLTLLAALSVI